MPGAERYEIESPALRAYFNKEGHITGIGVRAQGNWVERSFGALPTALEGPHVGLRVTSGPVSLAGGGLEWARDFAAEGGAQCTVRESCTPTEDGLHFSSHIVSTGEPWTAPLRTSWRYPAGAGRYFWAPWADPRPNAVPTISMEDYNRVAAGPRTAYDMETYGWQDPLQARPFEDRLLWYGAVWPGPSGPTVQYIPLLSDLVAIPMATLLEPRLDMGLSVVLSPEDLIFNGFFDTRSDGYLAFVRLHHRLGAGTAVHFEWDLVAHEGDWRGGLRWFARRYGDFVYPESALAAEVSGTWAYSCHGADLDLDKMRAMGFRVNWDAHFDFPYMGMFLPPVAPGEAWLGHRLQQVSSQNMEEYRSAMKQEGFYVLDYFNVTEFGNRVQWPLGRFDPVCASEDDWRSPQVYLADHLGDAVLRPPPGLKDIVGLTGPTSRAGGPVWSWEGCVVMDPGEPGYQAFLLEVAKRHLDLLPSSAGICIDRLDWLLQYQTGRDDGASFLEGLPTSSLLVSWADLMGKLGPMFHEAGKVIFVNPHLKRIDLLRHVDGLCDEFSIAPSSMNAAAFLGLAKPVLGWVGSEHQVHPDPDRFLQAFLHMGVFPMAPFPGNDHAIGPHEVLEQYYRDYGPLFEALRGRQWVLDPHPVTATSPVKVNAFRAKGRLLVTVTFGGEAPLANLQVATSRADGQAVGFRYRRPGDGSWHDGAGVVEGRKIDVAVPLSRGCVVVILG